ncbi:hypothetical protein STEG23_037400, partial [Scotinomys teguina]
MAMNYNAKDEVDGGPPCPPGGAAKTRRPDNTAFKQQRLPAWQPILTAGTVLPTFFIIGLIFIPIGIGIFVTSNNIREIEIDYTGTEPSSPCNKCLSPNVTSCVCTINFTLEQSFEGNVFMYYGLSNFYQNHRRYVKSRDDSQLNGDPSALLNPSKECEPYRRSEDKPIAPCGAIANSMFNDTLELFLVANESDPTPTKISLTRKGIAWWTDKNVKFRNPPGKESLEEKFKGTTKPVNWHKPVFMLDPDENNNGFINEDFIVWMRTAALPTFRRALILDARAESGGSSVSGLVSDLWRSVVAVGGQQLSQDVAEPAGPPSDCPEDRQHYFTETFRKQSSRETKAVSGTEIFEEDNGIPVHLKGGAADALLYRLTMALTVG